MQRKSSRALAASLAVTGGILLLMLVSSIAGLRELRHIEDCEMRQIALSGSIRHLDEALTMSANMAARTGDLAWEARYSAFEPQLDAVLREAGLLAGIDGYRGFVGATATANSKLVAMERRSFELVRAGRPAEAWRLLSGAEYARQKAVYSRGLQEFTGYIDLHVRQEMSWRRARSAAELAAAALGILVLFLLWRRGLAVLAESEEQLSGKNIQLAKALARLAELRDEDSGRTRLEHQVTLILSESADSLELAPAVLEALAVHFSAQCANWWLAAPGGAELQCSVAWTDGAAECREFSSLSRRARFPKGRGLPGRAWEAGRALWSGEARPESGEDPRAEAAARCGLDKAIAFPLRLEGETLGVLELAGFSVRPLKPEAESSLAAIGSHIAQRMKRRDSELLAVQAQKMEALGRMAAGVAHDFNNYLSSILGLCDLASKELPSGSMAADDVSDIRAAAEKASALTRQLLAFGRRKVGQAARVEDLNAQVAGLSRGLERFLGARYRFERELCEGELPVRVDPGRLEQCVLNLAINARDAMPGGGTLTLRTMRGRGKASLEVRDTGTGIAPENLPRVFEPFFSTKGDGKGAGLGLSVVHGFMAECGGRVELESAPGRGTCVRLVFPAPGEATQAAAALAKPAAETGLPVLVVDDEEGVRRVAERLLSGLGCRVRSAADAGEAERILQDPSCEVRLLLADVNMPGRGGLALAESTRRLRPELKIVFMSGYGREALEAAGGGEAEDFLAKPLTAGALSRKLAELGVGAA